MCCGAIEDHLSYLDFRVVQKPQECYVNFCAMCASDKGLSVEIRGDYFSIITLTDVLSRHNYVNLMKHKYQSFEKFKEFTMKFKISWTNTLNLLGQIEEVNSQHKAQGMLERVWYRITARLSYYISAQCVSEQNNQILLDMIWSMMSFINLPTLL